MQDKTGILNTMRLPTNRRGYDSRQTSTQAQQQAHSHDQTGARSKVSPPTHRRGHSPNAQVAHPPEPRKPGVAGRALGGRSEEKVPILLQVKGGVACRGKPVGPQGREGGQLPSQGVHDGLVVGRVKARRLCAAPTLWYLYSIMARQHRASAVGWLVTAWPFHEPLLA